MRACTKFGGGECKDLNLARLPKARALAEARQNEACCYCLCWDCGGSKRETEGGGVDGVDLPIDVQVCY